MAARFQPLFHQKNTMRVYGISLCRKLLATALDKASTASIVSGVSNAASFQPLFHQKKKNTMRAYGISMCRRLLATVLDKASAASIGLGVSNAVSFQPLIQQKNTTRKTQRVWDFLVQEIIGDMTGQNICYVNKLVSK